MDTMRGEESPLRSRSTALSIVNIYLRISCSCLPQTSPSLRSRHILVLEKCVVVEPNLLAGDTASGRNKQDPSPIW